MSGYDTPILLQIRYFPNMKHKPQSLTFCLFALVAAVSAVAQAWMSAPHLFAATLAQESADPAAEVANGETTTATSAMTADEVLDSVRARIESLDSLSAELHETIIMSGSRLTAVGSYSQASGNRSRLEFRLFPVRGVRAADANSDGLDEEPADTSELKPTASLTQVSDGGMLWSLWNNGGLQQLTRQNIREILDAVPKTGTPDATRMLQDLGAGGLQKLLAKLQAVMEFGPVAEQTIGETRFLVLTGRWTEESRRDFFNAPDATTPLPDFIPDFVRVYVDAEELIPRRIQYLKKHPDPAQTLVRPLVTLDFRKLSLNEPVPEETFVFKAPEGVVEENLTKQVIQQIQQLAKAKEEQAAGNGDPAAPDADATPEAVDQ